MVREQLWSLQLREKVTFLMLIAKFSCQTELFPKGKTRGKWRGEKKEEKSDDLKGEMGDRGDKGV